MPSSPRYWPFYCEENVWHLCRQQRDEGLELAVTIISNRAREVAIWNQRSASEPDLPVVWDYHVVLLSRADEGCWSIWDLDSTLAFPVDAEEYLDRSFDGSIAARYLPRFRLLTGDDYVRRLRSDRAHMLTDGGEWRRPPPPWPPIGLDRHSSSLPAWDLLRLVETEANRPGQVLTVAELRTWLDRSQGPGTAS